MFSFCRALLSFAFVCVFVLNGFSQIQDKEQSKAMVELAGEMLKASQAEDDVRDIMVQAADLDTTNIAANFEAGRLHLRTIKKDQAAKYLLRIYRQNPNYRFDLEYHIASSFQYGLQFDKAIAYYNRYKTKYQRNPNYQGRDKVGLREIERKLSECNNGKEFVANPKPYAIVNIGPQVNSEANDYAPVLNEREDEIIFTSRRLDGNINENVYSDNKPFEDIFISNKVNGKWTRATNIGRTINIPNHNSNLALSPDGKTLFQYRDENGGDIFVSELKSDNTWSSPKPLPGIINSAYMESSVSISPDGTTLYFASERPGGQGGLDLYVCTKDSKGVWSKVRNLGPTINTERHEDGPFIDYSGKKLYFSSESHKGMGGYDIFESNLLNPTTYEWSTPLNVGYPINTADNDIYFVGTADGKRGYYASVREDGLGYLDVYTISPKELVKTPTSVLPVKLVVKVIDAKTNTPLEVKIELLAISDSKPVTIAARTKGNYTFSVVTKDPKHYRLSVSLEGYFPQVEEITLQSADMVEKTITRTVGMAKSERVAVIVPLKYEVKVLDSKTNLPVEATVKFETTPENVAIAPTPKAGGIVEFSIIAPTTKTYKLSVSRDGYEAQSEQVSVEGAGTAAKTVSKTVSLVKKAPVIVPLKFSVKIVDEKTNQPIEAKLKLESTGDAPKLGTALKATGLFDFTIASPTSKEYNITVERDGYVSKTEKVTIEGAGETAKTISRTITLAEVKKEPVIVPLKFSVKVVDEKTNLPLEAKIKVESVGDLPKLGNALKITGLFDFLISSPTSKEYSISVERDGYVSKTERVTVEGAGETAKTITRTIALTEVRKEPVIVPLKFSVKVVDEKTNLPLDAKLKLESAGDAPKLGTALKASGLFDFSIASPTSKEYNITVERDGYVSKTEKVTIEAAGETAKTITRTITLAQVKKEPVIVPLKFSVKVVDEKTNLPLDAKLKLESEGDTPKLGTALKTSGLFDFSISSPTPKDYNITIERDGYVSKTEKVTIEAAGETAKTITRTITLAQVKKEPVIVPLKFSVKVVDEKTNLPLDAKLKLESEGDTPKLGTALKASGLFDFSIASPTSKEYNITVEREGYVSKTEKVTVEAAGETAKTITRTITLAQVKKEPVIVPLKFSVKVVDEKTNLPLEAKLKLESEGDAPKLGTALKASGLFDFSIPSPTSKEYSITVEREGYVSKTEKVTIEAAGETAKTITRTIMLAQVKKEPVIVPLKFSVKVVDEKTNLPLDAKLKLESEGDAPKLGTALKASGLFDFSIASPTSKEYNITVEREGYVSKTEKVTIEGAGEKAKTISRTITLKQVEKEVLPTVAVKLIVSVEDKKSGQPIEANVILQSATDNKKIEGISKGNGVYEFYSNSPKALNYKLSADREGYVYLAQQVKIEASTDKEKIITRKISLQPISIGATSVLRNLYFDVGKATIHPESFPELNAFENMMNQNPLIRVEISGHTDDVGDNAFNKNLSQLRANAVKNYLVSKGVDPKRIVAIGFGETKPLVSNDDEMGGREINRRVELKILSK